MTLRYAVALVTRIVGIDVMLAKRKMSHARPGALGLTGRGSNDDDFAFSATDNIHLTCVAHGNAFGSLSRPVRICSI